MDKIKTTITLSIETHSRVKKIALKEHRSISSQINVILDKYLENIKEEG